MPHRLPEPVALVGVQPVRVAGVELVSMMHAVTFPDTSSSATNAVEPETTIPVGKLKPVAPESMHPVSDTGVELPSMVHARTTAEPLSVINAVDPVMAMPYG